MIVSKTFFQCSGCGKDFPLDVNNGKTLCVPCHKNIHFGGVLRQSQ